MIDGYYTLGIPKPFKNICNIYAPTIHDIYSTPQYYMYVGMLLIDQADLNQRFQEEEHIPTPLEMLLSNCKVNTTNRQYVCNAISFFIHEEVLPLFDSGAFLIGDPQSAIENSNARLLNSDNFFDFQNEVRLAVGRDILENIDKWEDMDPRLRKMKLKREEAKKVKAKQAQKNGEGITLEQNLVAIFCMGIGITPLNIGEMTYASVINIVQGYQAKESYDTTIRAMTSGFGSKNTKTPKYWMTQI